MTKKRILTITACLLLCLATQAQGFFNLTADEVRLDSLLPVFNYQQPLGPHYADSVYTVSIDYPEFIDMSAADVSRYERLAQGRALPALPEVQQYVGVARKQGTLYASLVPLVQRDGKYQKLVSFKLTVTARPAGDTPATARNARQQSATRAAATASQSVLASGQWVKIRVPATGVYHLSDALVRQAGFSDPSRVKVYGYGGAMQPERLTASYLLRTDDLQEVPTCTVGGRRLFRATGPVSWSSNSATTRTRNPYSDYGYYFLTEDGSEPLAQDSTAFVDSFYPATDDYHSLYEVDNFAWYHGGRNLYDSQLLGDGQQHRYLLTASSTSGLLTVVMTYDGPCAATITVNGQEVGTISSNATITSDTDEALMQTRTFSLVDMLTPTDTITLYQTSGANMRLDYLALTSLSPAAEPQLSTGAFAVPELVGRITNQNRHADEPADMIIIIPTSQKLLAQAERLADAHREKDGLRVRIVPAGELYNEFSSGTPDANAYRRYLKMLYDRAETEADMPRFLMLFGDGAWDNRMKLADWRGYSPDDFLLCYESEASLNHFDCYVSDDYFCLLDDGEGADMLTRDKTDVAVGRFPVRTAAEAKILVDKTLGYMNNDYAGAWQNTICQMGDDGSKDSDGNKHMKTADDVATYIQEHFPGYHHKKIYWDAYTPVWSSTGKRYPDVERLIRQQMQNGALIMNYSGHGAAYSLSHEYVLRVADFALPTSQRLPLWVTASCDIMGFDGNNETIGETAMLNSNGGAVAFYGTTRTVYLDRNDFMNKVFIKHALGTGDDGLRIPLGEAVRRAKNELMTPRSSMGSDYIGNDYTINKLHYHLLGDPALRLARPTMTATIDSIGKTALGQGGTRPTLAAGTRVTVKGHIDDGAGFNGVVTAIVSDAEETIVCKRNEVFLDTAFTFKDRQNIIYHGTDSVRNGQFSFTFAVPKDIKYANGTGQITIYALSNDRQQEAHGENTDFVLNGDSIPADDGIGPSIYCYLNSTSFANGGNVNKTPYFYATLTDKDGINASGSGIGHDLQLTIDGKMTLTYTLNDYFQYDFGDYRSGSVGFSIPELPAGGHTLQFKAWDVLNNSSTAELSFNVVEGLSPQLFSVDCTHNPATTQTTFIISHDRTGSLMDTELEVFDTAGRLLWRHTASGVPTDQAFTLDWDLTTGGGRRLQTGVYLYRASISSDGSKQTSAARKLVVMGH